MYLRDGEYLLRLKAVYGKQPLRLKAEEQGSDLLGRLEIKECEEI